VVAVLENEDAGGDGLLGLEHAIVFEGADADRN
jgi:hypothetical protein